MPTLPAAHPVLVIASGFLLEALLLASFLGFSHLPSAGVPLQDMLAGLSRFLTPLLCAIAGVGLLARRRFGWWAGIGAALSMMLSAPAALIMAIRYAVVPGMDGVAQFVIGLGMMTVAKMGWHLMLLLGLMRADVRERVGVTGWEPARAVTVTAFAFTAFAFAGLALQLSLGW